MSEQLPVSSGTPRLQVTNLTRSFSGTRALSDVTLHVARGEILGLVGENGAGKSTLLNILSGVLDPDSGVVELDGLPVVQHDHRQANSAGVFRVFQEPALVENLTVYENVFFGWESLFGRRGLDLNRGALRAAARVALDNAGLAAVDVDARISRLSPGIRQGIDIARATELARRLQIDHPVVLFDEPTTALDQTHEENFLRLMQRLRGNAAVVLVSHRLSELLETCDRIVVLKDGAVVADRSASELDEAALHHAMVGRARSVSYYRENRQSGVEHGEKDSQAERLELRDVAVPGPWPGAEVSLSVAAGEIVGVVGVEGCGKRELGALIAGDLTAAAGLVLLDGSALRPGTSAAVDAGIAYVSRDRAGEGLVLDASITDNIALASWHDKLGNRFGIVSRRRARGVAEDYRTRLGIVAREGVGGRVGALSGGNQQKVLLAKWLYRQPRVLVLDGPTQGVDSGAREAIYDIVRDASDAGIAVLLLSDDLPELIGLSHRIIVMVNGEITDVVDCPADAKPDEQRVVALMIPAHSDRSVA